MQNDQNLLYICRFEKAFDRVPREVTRWALRKAGVEEWLVKAVMVMYRCICMAQTVVRTTEGDSKAFNVKVGFRRRCDCLASSAPFTNILTYLLTYLHQGSILSHLLFVIVMEMISREL